MRPFRVERRKIDGKPSSEMLESGDNVQLCMGRGLARFGEGIERKSWVSSRQKRGRNKVAAERAIVQSFEVYVKRDVRRAGIQEPPETSNSVRRTQPTGQKVDVPGMKQS